MTIELRPVTAENWEALIKLRVREDQKHFIASNAYSMVQAQFGAEYEGHWDFFARGIYDGDTPVGFLMYGFNFGYSKHQAFIQRLMVDENFQGKGYGRFGMEAMLKIFRADERIKTVGISYEPNNETGRKIYASLGFAETGEIDDGEVIAELKLR